MDLALFGREASIIFMDSLSIFINRSFIGPEVATNGHLATSLSIFIRRRKRSFIGPEAATIFMDSHDKTKSYWLGSREIADSHDKTKSYWPGS